MTDAPKTEAQEAAAALLAEYGPPTSHRDMLHLLALAYTRGAVVAATEAADVARRA